MNTNRTAATERFFAKVEVTDGCWLWTACVCGPGYGQFWVPGEQGEGKVVLAHRWSYEHHVGPIPDGLELDHICRIRRCVNPQHLEPVTRLVNNARGESLSAQRKRQTHCRHGHSLDDENTRIDTNGRRVCRTCHRARERARRERQRPEVQP